MNGKPWMVPTLLGMMAVAGCGGEEPVEDLAVVEDAAVQAPAPVPADTGTGDLATWNTDADARLSSSEFGVALDRRGWYDRWDADSGGGVSGEEFGAGALGVWDADEDQRVSEAEWSEASAAWYGEGEDAGAFADWDASGDSYLDESELGSGFETTGLFGRWDRDRSGALERQEWNEGVFGTWDANDDTFVDETEWGEGSNLWR